MVFDQVSSLDTMVGADQNQPLPEVWWRQVELNHLNYVCSGRVSGCLSHFRYTKWRHVIGKSTQWRSHVKIYDASWSIPNPRLPNQSEKIKDKENNNQTQHKK